MVIATIEPMTESSEGRRSLRFARSVSIGLLGQGFSLLANFLAIPILMRALGTDTYGFYILLHTATSYIAMTTLGAGPAVMRYTAQFKASGDGAALKQIARYAAFFYLISAALGTTAAWLLAPWVASDILRLSGPLGMEAIFIIRSAAAASAFLAFFDMALAFLQGLQLFGRHAVLGTVQNAGFLVVAAALAFSGEGLRTVALWYTIWAAILAAIGLSMAWISLKNSAGPGHQRMPVRDFLRFGLGGGFGRFAWIVTNQFDKTYIARTVSLTDLTLYSVPLGLLQRIQIVQPLISVVIMPMMTEVHGKGERRSLEIMYLKSVRFVLWAVMPFLVFLFAIMPQFLGLWLGGAFAAKSVWTARLLIMAQVFYFLEGQALNVIFTRDKPWHLTALSWLKALLSVIGWKLLVAKHSILGIAAGTLGAQAICAAAALLYNHHRLMGLKWSDYGKALAAPVASAILALAVIFPFHDQATTWPLLFLAAALVAAVYYGTTWLMMSRDDRSLLRTFLERYRPGLYF